MIDKSQQLYICIDCPVRGRRIGSSWPPLRTSRYIMPENKTCEGARHTAIREDLRKRGIVMDELGDEPRPYSKSWMRERLGVSGDVDE